MKYINFLVFYLLFIASSIADLSFQHEGFLSSVAFSPDGKIIATAGGPMDGGVLILWDAATGAKIQTIRDHWLPICSIEFSPDGRRIATGGGDNVIFLWDVGTGVRIQEYLGHTSWINDLAFTADGTRLFSAGDDSTIKIWDVQSGDLIHSIKIPNWGFSSIDLDEPRRRFITAENTHPYMNRMPDPGVIRMWSMDTWEQIDRFPTIDPFGFPDEMPNESNMAFFIPPDKSRIASAIRNVLPYALDEVPQSQIDIWQIEEKYHWYPARTIKAHRDAINSLEVSPDGKFLLTGSDDKSVILWDMIEGSKFYEIGILIFALKDRVVSVKFSPDGQSILCGCVNGKATLRSLEDDLYWYRLQTPVSDWIQY